MLFNSFEFIFVFLPIALIGFAATWRAGPRVSCAWLALCSIAFYAYWNIGFVGLLLSSIAVNFAFGHAISASQSSPRRNWLLAAGVTFNIVLLAAVKYLEPTIRLLHQHALISTDFDLHIILPLGISFFTFTQIGYLVDRRDGLGDDLDLPRYAAFVTFFPHLIAGPILHVRDIGPQFSNSETLRITPAMAAPGATLFVSGLAKKVLLADPLASVVQTGFDDPARLGMAISWIVALAYAAQLYFDFSGYSDMAVGLAALFGIRFPANFNSPFKSRSVIEYWQRWHMTLSRYLNLLLYNPVALAIVRWRAKQGKGVGPKDRRKLGAFAQMVAAPTLFTMTLAGIWHGAGLQFLIFGVLHGVYLIINHAWRMYGPRAPAQPPSFVRRRVALFAQVGVTFLAVLVGFIFFRAESAAAALRFLQTMVGVHGWGLPGSVISALSRLDMGLGELAGAPGPADVLDRNLILRLIVSFLIIWAAPNAMQILGDRSPATGVTLTPAPRWMQWRPNLPTALLVAALFFLCVIQLRQTTVFLYFQF